MPTFRRFNKSGHHILSMTKMKNIWYLYHHLVHFLLQVLYLQELFTA